LLNCAQVALFQGRPDSSLRGCQVQDVPLHMTLCAESDINESSAPANSLRQGRERLPQSLCPPRKLFSLTTRDLNQAVHHFITRESRIQFWTSGLEFNEAQRSKLLHRLVDF